MATIHSQRNPTRQFLPSGSPRDGLAEQQYGRQSEVLTLLTPLRRLQLSSLSECCLRSTICGKPERAALLVTVDRHATETDAFNRFFTRGQFSGLNDHLTAVSRPGTPAIVKELYFDDAYSATEAMMELEKSKPDWVLQFSCCLACDTCLLAKILPMAARELEAARSFLGNKTSGMSDEVNRTSGFALNEMAQRRPVNEPSKFIGRLFGSRS